MRFLEIFGVLYQIGQIIQLIDAWLEIEAFSLDGSVMMPMCATNTEVQIKGLRGAQPWFFLEIAVLCVYTMTMLILLVKSRFVQVGIDQDDQFDQFLGGPSK